MKFVIDWESLVGCNSSLIRFPWEPGYFNSAPDSDCCNASTHNALLFGGIKTVYRYHSNMNTNVCILICTVLIVESNT